MRKHQSGDVRTLDSQTLSTTATCFQCDGDGRRAGLKIRWDNTRVGSSAMLQAMYNHFIFIMLAGHSDKGDID